MNAGRPAGPALGETMEKEAFLRLPEAKRELLLKKGKEAYVRYPFEDITIRFLTGELGIDPVSYTHLDVYKRQSPPSASPA